MIGIRLSVIDFCALSGSPNVTRLHDLDQEILRLSDELSQLHRKIADLSYERRQLQRERDSLLYIAVPTEVDG